MRKLTIIIIMLFCATATYAQKAKVVQAQSLLTSGKLDDAKRLIDEAITNENCVNDPKSNFVMGQIYQSIAESRVDAYKKLSTNALDIAYDAYKKVIEFDVKNKFQKQLVPQYNNLTIAYTDKAILAYNEDDYKTAYTDFLKVLELQASPLLNRTDIDTAIIYNTAMAAHKANELEAAEKFYKQSLSYNYEPARCYATLSSILKQLGREDEAIEYLHKGSELFPNDAYMLVELINYYLMGGEPEKAEKYLDAAIEQDPGNASFYRAKGSLYEKMEEYDKAIDMNQKALSIDPNDFAAQYNLGAMKLNKVIEFHNKVNDIMDQKEYDKGLLEVYKQYEEVVPYFEKAYELNPTEVSTLNTLRELYFKLRNTKSEYMEKYEKIKAQLDQQ
ncbi:tetratricopeptide repeat protein [Odoribacter sp. OttesenSCG-928-J03]|nr:tetratricopeptide repeat protein [Odoribacter sp. OttesenSCG-928-J03]